VELKPPVKFSIVKPNLDKPFPMIGIQEMSWSFDSNFLATKNDNMPHTLFVWQVSTLSLHTVILQNRPIKSFSWSPTDHILLICTENSKLYSFTLTNVYVVELVTDINLNLNINRISWNPDGRVFTVSDNKNLIIGQPEINDDNQHLIEEQPEETENNYQQSEEQYEQGEENYEHEQGQGDENYEHEQGQGDENYEQGENSGHQEGYDDNNYSHNQEHDFKNQNHSNYMGRRNDY
jgi:hypothetical protein